MVALLAFSLAGTGIAADVFVYNPQPPTTVQMPGNECSTTAYGPGFFRDAEGLRLYYGGGVSCAGGTGQKALRIYAQIRGRDQTTWYTLDGSLKEVPTTTGNPVRLTVSRVVAPGHVYRVAAAGFVYRNGRASTSTAFSPGWTIP